MQDWRRLMTNKMNKEQIKQLLKEEQIRVIIHNAYTLWSGDSVSVDGYERAWHNYVYFNDVWSKTGWSRATVRKRWEELQQEGFIKLMSRSMIGGNIHTLEWRDRVDTLAKDGLIAYGLSRSMQDIKGRDLKRIEDKVFHYVMRFLK